MNLVATQAVEHLNSLLVCVEHIANTPANPFPSLEQKVQLAYCQWVFHPFPTVLEKRVELLEGR
jgi:hypothetical protein